MNTYSFGAVADDLTGACDLAAGLSDAGLRTLVLLGLPDRAPRADAVVVAQRTRTAPADEAVRRAVDAVRWLLDTGAEWVYQKYGSTFDSTADGNIGPVADAMSAVLDERYAGGFFLASVGGGEARVTVRFDADIAAVTRDGDGQVVAGSTSDAVETHDVWTFVRQVKTADPNWILADTDEA